MTILVIEPLTHASFSHVTFLPLTGGGLFLRNLQRVTQFVRTGLNQAFGERPTLCPQGTNLVEFTSTTFSDPLGGTRDLLILKVGLRSETAGLVDPQKPGTGECLA